jgi:S1-C subfamily serine protease
MAEGPTSPESGTPPPDDRVSSRLGRRLVPFGLGAAAMLGGVLAYGVLAPATPPPTHQDVAAAIASALASVTPPPAFSQSVYQAVQPSLVLIETTGGETEATEDEHDGLGSGVVVTLAGDILTSLHVVEGAASIDLTFADGSRSPGVIAATDPGHDIAVLSPTRPPAQVIPATLGNPGAVRQGSEAYALGSPFGLYGSVSSGVISGLDRSFKMPDSARTLTGLIQIDAAVNPGNSGGALVDRDGRLIGIITALINPTSDEVFIGIGLAVPIDVAGRAAGLPPY